MRKTSVSKLYKFYLLSQIFISLTTVLSAIVIISSSSESINDQGNSTLGLLFEIVVITALAVLLIISIKTIVLLLKDFDNYRKKKYITVEGQVIGFKKNRDPESGLQMNNTPIINVVDTNERVVLNINDSVCIGKTYVFHYLKYSKIAEVEKDCK